MKKNKDLNQVKAIYKNLRSSPRKINNILKSIRGKNANIAMRDLEFTDKRVANEIKKTLKSAIANAENNNQLNIDNLIVKEAYVGKGITLKRFMPRARGRAAGIKNRVRVVVGDVVEVEGLPVYPVITASIKAQL